MSNDVPHFFADSVINVTHVNGVFRLTFAQQVTSDNMEPTVQILIPGNQLGTILAGVGKAAENIANRRQDALPEAPAKKTAPAKKKAPAKTTRKPAAKK